MAKIFNTLPRLPDELKEQGRFCLWRYETVKDRKTKVPYSTDGRRAQSNNKASFRDFDIVESRFEFSKGEPVKYDGIGIGIFGNLCGIDIDHCINAGGEFSPLALQVIDAIDGYTEYSPSRNGVHILFFAPTLQEAIEQATGRTCSTNAELKNAFLSRWNAKTKTGLEFYSDFSPRYFTVTGYSIRQGSLAEDKTSRLLAVLDKCYLKEGQEQQAAQPSGISMTDEQLLEKAMNAANGAAFRALWEGDITGYTKENGEPDNSRAHMAFMNFLAYWTGGDAARMESLFSRSALAQNEKWRRPDYRKRTIDAALRACKNFYDPSHGRSDVADDFQVESDEIDEKTAEEQKAEYLASTADRLIPEFFDDVQAKAATPAIPTGFSQLDKALDGGLYEGLYIIGGISSIGKTTFCLQMADQIAEAGHDVLIFSLEMSKYELISRSLSRHTFQALRQAQRDAGEGTDYDKNRFRDAKTSRGITSFQRWSGYSTEERQLIADAAQRYADFGGRVWIREGLGNTGAKDIRADVEKHVAYTGRSPVVLLDYLQILEPYSERMTDKQNTDKSVKLLKIMSRDFKIPVLAISSFNRANYKTAVDMEAFKESGAIEYSSDVLIGLQLFGAGEKWYRASEEKRKTPRRVQACILKNRNGPTGNNINLKYFAMFNCFEETFERFMPPVKEKDKATGSQSDDKAAGDDEPYTVGDLFGKREVE